MAVTIATSSGKSALFAILGTATAFEGNILANQSVTLDTGATIINVRALAENAAVTLDTDTISIAGCLLVTGAPGTFVPGGPSVPEPGLVALFVGMGLPLSGLLMRRRLRR